MLSVGDIILIILRILLDALIIFTIAKKLISLSYDPRIIGAMIFFSAVLAMNFISKVLGFAATSWISGKFIEYSIIILIILFQPEIRKIILGMKLDILREKTALDVIESIVEAVSVLSERKDGALIVVEGSVDTTTFTRGGRVIDANISAELIISVFSKSSPIHDGAMIVKGQRIHMVSAVLPISKRDFPIVGMRHRAGVGITEETDAVSVIVSESGKISFACAGNLLYDISLETLREKLLEFSSRNSKEHKVSFPENTTEARVSA